MIVNVVCASVLCNWNELAPDSSPLPRLSPLLFGPGSGLPVEPD